MTYTDLAVEVRHEDHGRVGPAVDSEETRVLTNFAWRCPNGHQFATAMPDVPLVSWRRLTERPYA